MKSEVTADKLPIAKIAVKGSCPVCGAIKLFQEFLLEHLGAVGTARLCNFHAWSLAKSAPADVVASLFLNALKVREWDAVPASSCIVCKKLQEEEVERIKEVTIELGRSTSSRWLQQYSRFCLRHIRELKRRVPEPLQDAIEELGRRSVLDLEEELGDFLQRVRHGDHVGGGILGRAAEFLVGQRGIFH